MRDQYKQPWYGGGMNKREGGNAGCSGLCGSAQGQHSGGTLLRILNYIRCW